MRHIPLFILLLCFANCQAPATEDVAAPPTELDLDRESILAAADKILGEDPVTVTDFIAERSAGGLHDYYSEGRYWWPDEDNPRGPYVRRDGVSNPQNFSGHKNALKNLSESVSTLTAAYALSGDQKYADKAIEHLRAWFVNLNTIINPHMLYGQAIKGITTGRGIGIIDTLRLIDVALSVELLRKEGKLAEADDATFKKWFGDFGDWLTTHPYGEDEKTNNNNHSTWWGAQVAAFARASERPDLMDISKEQFREQLPIQVAVDGSLPDELGRTKPFHYMNYTLEAWGTYATLLDQGNKDQWEYEFTTTLEAFKDSRNREAGDGEPEPVPGESISLEKAMAYSLPYMDGSQEWPYLSDLEKEIHPHRNDYLVFAWWGLGDERYLKLWKELENDEPDLHANLVVWQELKK